MQRSRVVFWSVGLALGLSGCAGTGQQKVASAPSPLSDARDRVASRLLAWRTREAPAAPSVVNTAARPDAGGAPADADADADADTDGVARTSAEVAPAAADKGADPWPARKKDQGPGRISRYFPGLNRGADAQADTAGAPGRDLWADAARVALARHRADKTGEGVDGSSVLPVALNVGASGTAVRPRVSPGLTPARQPKAMVASARVRDPETEPASMPVAVEAPSASAVEPEWASGRSEPVPVPVPDEPSAPSLIDPALASQAAPPRRPAPSTKPAPETAPVAPVTAPEPAPVAPVTAPEPTPAPVQESPPAADPAPIPAPAPKPAEETPSTAPKPAEETTPKPAPKPAEETPAPAAASETPAAPEPSTHSHDHGLYTAPSGPAPAAQEYAVPSKQAPAPSKQLPVVPSKQLPVVPSKQLPTYHAPLTTPSKQTPVTVRTATAQPTLAAGNTAPQASGRPTVATAQPHVTPTDRALFTGSPFPPSYYGVSHAAPVAAPVESRRVAAYQAPKPRKTIVARFMARFRGEGAARPVEVSPAGSVGGAETRDLAEAGEGIQRVSAERLGEPAQR